jgi:membrane protein YdbS with pleckstrin-like domain
MNLLKPWNNVGIAMNKNNALAIAVGLLQTILVVLKFLGVLNCTWWQALLPTIIIWSLSAFAIALIIALVIINQVKYHSCR